MTHQKALQAAFEDRVEADYEGGFPSRENVEQRLSEAGDFVQAVIEFLKGQGLDV